jgi:hypothetical protein
LPKRVLAQGSRVTVYHKVRQWFRARGNPFATISEIADGVGADEGIVRSVVYTTHNEQFLRLPKVKGRKVACKLAEAARAD